MKTVRSLIPVVFTVNDHLLHCFQIAEPVEHVGQQVTAFHPFVPRVDGDQFGLFGVAVGIFFRFGEQGCKTLGRVVVVHHIVDTFCGKTRRIVPSDGHAGKDRYIQDRVHLFPYPDRIGAVSNIIFNASAHIVHGNTVETHRFHTVGKLPGCRFRHQGAAALVPLDMQPGETGLFHFIAEIIQRFTGFFHTVAKAFQQFVHTEDGKYRLAVDFKIVRSLEILVDDPVHDDLIVFPVHFGVPQDIGIVLVAVNSSSNCTSHRGWPT